MAWHDWRWISSAPLILQPFHLHLRHSSFSNPSFASPTSQALHLLHLAICVSYKIFAKYCGRHWQKQGSDWLTQVQFSFLPIVKPHPLKIPASVLEKVRSGSCLKLFLIDCNCYNFMIFYCVFQTSVTVAWSVESLPSNSAALVWFHNGSGILISVLGLDVSFVFCQVISGEGPDTVLTTHSGRHALVYLSSVLVQRLLLPLQASDPRAFGLSVPGSVRGG